MVWIRLDEFVDRCVEYYRREYENKENRFHAKYLVYCRERMDKIPYEVVAREPAVLIGQLVDSGVSEILGIDRKVVYEKEIGDYTVVGTPDIYDDELVEVKFTMYSPRSVREHDKLQVQLYMWILGLDEAYIWYLSPRSFKEFKINETISDEDVIKLIEEPRYPTWEWECKYCDVHPCVYRR